MLAAVPLVGSLAQGALGGITVLTDLHPVTVAALYLLSMLLISASTGLLLAAIEPPAADPDATLVRREVRREVRASRWPQRHRRVVLVLGTVVTGSDHTPATRWSRPGSGSTRGPRPGCTPTAVCLFCAWWWASWRRCA